MEKEKRSNILDKLIIAVAVAMGIFHLISTQYLFQSASGFNTTHLTFSLVLVFLITIRTEHRLILRLLGWIFLLAGLVATTYIIFNQVPLEYRAGFPNTTDFIIGIILVAVVMEGTRRVWGVALPIVGVFLLIYFFFGHLLPGPLRHAYLFPGQVVSQLGMGLGSGIFGIPLVASANYIFLFLLFGGLLEVAKVDLFFIQLGKAAGRLLAGGPAQTAVVSSGLVGMVMGAAVANVALTGAFTIPLMKKVGYTPEQAGAIEATASTGGQFTPPVMGVTAFLIAGIVGIPYIDVAVAGIIPAIFFYFAVAIGVQVMALRLKLKPPREAIDVRAILKVGPLFIIPLGVIIYLLSARYSPMYAAFYAIISLIALSYIQKETRPPLSVLAHGFTRGAIAGAKIGIALAFVGTFIAALTFTGLGVKIGEIVRAVSGGMLVPALLMTMLLCLVLGTGLPTPAAYIIVAVVAVPLLVELGVVPLHAHLFAFYFAIISSLTPPVALAALAGSSIAGGKYFRTALEAFRLGITGFVIPFLIVFNPVLTLRAESATSAVVSLLAVALGIITLTALLFGFLFVKTGRWERLLFALSAAGLFVFAVTMDYRVFIPSLVLTAGLLWSQWRRRSLASQTVTLSR